MTHRWSTASPRLLAGLLAVAGTAHFVATAAYERIVPTVVPHPRAVVYASGLAELACAAGVAYPRTRRIAGWATAALFVAVFPANLQMALDSPVEGHLLYRLAAWARLPLQLPLVLWAGQVARRAEPLTARRPPSR